MAGLNNPYNTLWDTRYRSNVESEIYFIGDNVIKQHILFPLDSRYDFGTGDFSFDFFAERQAGSGLWAFEILSGSYSITCLINTTGDTVIIRLSSPDLVNSFNESYPVEVTFDKKYHITVTRSGQDIEVFLNGVSLGINQLDTANADFDFSVPGIFIIGIRGVLVNNAAKGTYSHFKVFNSKLSLQEVNFIHSEGGLIPVSSHSSCIAHYPLTERYAFKADSDFVAKHPQFSVGDNVFFDTVNQYNYAKTTPISAKHARAVNFTDAELGTGGDVRTQTNKFNFYEKNINIWFDGAGDAVAELNTEKDTQYSPLIKGLFYDGVDDQQNFGALATPFQDSKSFTLISTFQLPDYPNAKSGIIGLVEFYNDGYDINDNKDRIRLDYSAIAANQLRITASTQNDIQLIESNMTYEIVSGGYNQIIEVAVRFFETDSVNKLGTGQLLINGVQVYENTSMQTPNLSALGQGASPECNIGVTSNNITHKGHIFRVALFNERKSNKYILESWNNSLLKNAFSNDGSLQFYVQSNEGSYYDDAGTEMITELVNGNDGEVVGYVDLPDLITNLDNINDLR